MNNQLHQRPRSEASLSDEWETPRELLNELQKKYNIYYLLDVASTKDNSRGIERLDDGLLGPWLVKTKAGHLVLDVWCNPPHSKNEAFVRKAYDQWLKNNLNIMMILPANTCSSLYWHQCIENIAEVHPIQGRIKFLVNGKPSKFPSRNAYVCIIWRKRNEI